MNAEGKTLTRPDPEDLTLADRYIRSKLSKCIADVRGAFDNYRFDLAASALYEFIWNELCDWYIELTKPILWAKNPTSGFGSEKQKNAVLFNLLEVLEVTLRLAHPIMPFITEEIYRSVAPLVCPDYKDGDTIMLKSYPEAADYPVDADALKEQDYIKEFVVAVRNFRAEKNLSPAQKLSPFMRGDAAEIDIINRNSEFVNALANLESVFPADGDIPPVIAVIVGRSEILFPAAGVLNKDAELARIKKEIAYVESEIARVNQKLGNPAFTSKAPAQVIEKERAKLPGYEESLAKLRDQLKMVESL
jgi:valyl-tRNA synthetase